MVSVDVKHPVYLLVAGVLSFNGCHRRIASLRPGVLRAVRFSTFPQSGKSISEYYWGLNLPAFVVAGLGLRLGWGGVGVGAWAKTG